MPRPSRWWAWVQRNLDSRGWTIADLARAVERVAPGGPSESAIGRWKNRGAQPSVESVRAIARAFQLDDIREAFVVTGGMTWRELHAPWPDRIPTPASVDLTVVPDEDFAREAQRRLTRPQPVSAHRPNSDASEKAVPDAGRTVIRSRPPGEGHAITTGRPTSQSRTVGPETGPAPSSWEDEGAIANGMT